METAENKRFIYQFGKFVLDPQEKTLFSEGVPLHLPAKEFETLLLLVENNGRALAKDEMMTAIWQDAFVEEVNLAKQISRLRKIFNSGGEKYIETLPKHGYRFSAEVSQILQPAEETILEKRTIKRLTVRLENETQDAPALLPKKRLLMTPFLLIVGAVVLIAAAAGIWLWNRTPVAPGAKINSIAVLPLKPLTDEEKNKQLGLGLTDALITKIGSLKIIKVRPLSSVVKHAGNDSDAVEIGKTLSVDAVLEGTIQQSDGHVRINVRLLRVENGEQIWAEKFDAEAAQFFELEDRLSEQTARALKGKLGIGGEHLTKRFTSNAEAFDAYLKGRYFWNKRTEADFRKAIEYFTQAVEKDPNYALAYSGLADCYILLGVWGAEKPKEVFPQAEQYAEKALRADPELAEALVSRAFVRWVYDWDFERADADFARAIELNPNYATAHHWYSYFLVSEGRSERAIDEIKTARDLEGPLNISVNTDIGEIYSWTGRYAEADAALREVLKIEPNYAVARHVLAINLLKQNRVREAVAEAEAARRLESEPRVLAVLTYAYAADKNRAKALQTFNELNEAAKQKYVSPFSKAIALIGLGEREAAVTELEKAFEERSDTMVIINVYPLLGDLRADPRFVKLRRQVGQTPR